MRPSRVWWAFSACWRSFSRVSNSRSFSAAASASLTRLLRCLHEVEANPGRRDGLHLLQLIAKMPLRQQHATQQDQGGDTQARDDLLPAAEAAPQVGELVLQPLQLQFEHGVVRGAMAQVAVLAQPLPPRFLQCLTLGLVGGGIRVVRIAGQVEPLGGQVVRAALLGEDDPGFLALALRVEELVLGVGDAAKGRVRLGRLGAVAPADDLDEALAIVDLVAEDLPEVARFGPEDVLPDGVVTEPLEHVGRQLPDRLQLGRDRRDEDPRFHVGISESTLDKRT